MGKKYIIELEEPEMFDDRKFYTCSQMPWWAVSENIVENLTPYTEPDLEQVRQKAYDKAYADAVCNCSEGCSHVEQVSTDAYLKGLNDGQGVIFASTQNNAFNNGYKKCLEDMEQVRKETYQQGLSDAWEAARKIANMPYGEEEKVFGSGGWKFIINHTASEAIEKIRQYEQEKEKSEEQKKQESITAEEVMRQYLDNFCRGRNCGGCPLHTPDFTCGRGKHFLHDCVSNEEVRRAYAIVLAKMKEEL